MDKEMICQKAHEEYHMLLEKMMMSFEDPTITITKDEADHYNLLRNLCNDMIMDKQRKYLWNPLNKAVNEADGIHTVYIDDTSHFMHDVKGHDLNKAIAHALKHIDSIKMTDPVKYNALVAEIKA